MNDKKIKSKYQNKFDSVSLGIASPEKIKKWSFGEVTKPETVNYRTGRNERNGLFDERIFGPEKDFECYCGKYKGIRYRDIVCEKCGVEITKSIVRRTRMGHIELATPVAHIWFMRTIPSRLGLLLNIGVTKLEKVVYFSNYIVSSVNEKIREKTIKDLKIEYKTKIKILKDEKDKERLKDLFISTKKDILQIHKYQVLTEDEFNSFSLRYGSLFEAGIGAEAIYDLLIELDLSELKKGLLEELENTKSVLKKLKTEKRLNLVNSLIKSKTNPEWMFIKVLPIIPPALRPMVALEGGRYATSDINDLYRRVINRNNRLKKLKEINAPEVILRNEKRILQEAVDALMDNSMRKSSGAVAMSQSQNRILKSLSDNLKGKQGLFRQNLLGKRVDYSGRSVIVVGPRLKLSQCGLPKYMALELFRPFVISKILIKELAFNVRGAGKLIEDPNSEIWDILEDVIKGKYVLLNRAPTLHRLGIQAFHPVLIEGKAIQLHPLVCPAFNADFDGDQMAVHLPLSKEAQKEAELLMASNKNLLKPQSGDPIITPDQDIVLGVFWMTKSMENVKGAGKIFTSPNEAIAAYDFGALDFRASIKVIGTESERYLEFEGKPFDTTVGRLLFNSVLPNDFKYINNEIRKKDLSEIINELIYKYGVDETPPILDKIKEFGYKYSTYSGITFGFSDIKIPKRKKEIIKATTKDVAILEKQFNDGLISENEKYKQKIELWERTKLDIKKEIEINLKESQSIYDITTSGARRIDMVQMAGMKGIIVNTTGEAIDFPIKHSYIEGLDPIEYFITTHGSRKGLIDTALKTADAGYLTRRLHDVAQDIVVTEEDCKTKEGIIIEEENIEGYIKPISEGVYGRILQEEIKDEKGKTIYKKGDLIFKDDAMNIKEAGVKKVKVRSVRTCKTLHGVCQKCYGLDLGRNYLIRVGEAVGTIASQAIGEPGTQLTLRTFHAGGVIGLDITTGLPRIVEIFERRNIKIPATVSTVNGEVVEIKKTDDEIKIEVISDTEIINKTKKTRSVEYVLGLHRVANVKKGDRIKKGDILTDGSANIIEIYEAGGIEKAQDYIIREVGKVYDLNGAPVSKKHIEIITRQMFSRIQVISSGDSQFTKGEIIEKIQFENENSKIEEESRIKAKGKIVAMGITEVALTTKSWLSSASFQHTTRVLVNSSIKGKIDNLRGLKENIILGNLIPAGTGFSDDFIDFGDKDVDEKEEL